MRISRQSRFLALTLLTLCTMGSKCHDDEAVVQPQIGCTPGTAQIAAWDTLLQVVCGCGGTDGAFVPRDSSLACTFPVGNTLFIYFYGTHLRQLVPVGSPALPATPLYDPDSNTPIAAFSILPTAAGVYQFQDQFDGSLVGTITVTP